MCEASSRTIKTDVTCVKIIGNNVLAGVGGYLHIFDKRFSLLKSKITIFDGQKIYGIDDSILACSHHRCLIYGGKEIKAFDAETDNDSDDGIIKALKETASRMCKDWILQAKYLDYATTIATVFMHNIVVLWTHQLQPLKRVLCEQQCILYSAHLVGRVWTDLTVLSGTVFSEIVIWQPIRSQNTDDLAPVLNRLVGHKGVIFSIDCNQSAGIVCTTSDDRSVRLWTICDGESLAANLRCSLFGHSARVFKCKVLSDCVLSAGEDSVINIWDFEGKLIRKIDAQQNGCVWELDCDKNETIVVSGGGDCGVALFPLKIEFKRQKIRNDTLVPKRFVLLKDDRLITISEDGTVSNHCVEGDRWSTVKKHDDLASYGLLEVAQNRKLIALAGFRGTIHIYKLSSGDELSLVCTYTIEKKCRIYAIHWLSDDTFLTCEAEGIMQMWAIEKESLRSLKAFVLPPSKERWSSAACLLSFGYLVVGDRKGCLYVYNFEKTEPIQEIKKAHNYLGITHLYFRQNTLLSLGRNSIVRTFSFDLNHRQLVPVTSNKLPFAWLSSVHHHQITNTTLILGFLNYDFLIWDHDNRRILMQMYCGGGHRCWDFCENGNGIDFAFLNNKQIVLTHFNWLALLPVDLISGYHTSEINAIECLHQHFASTQTGIIISGGEDTTLRISRLNFKDDIINHVCLQNIYTLKSHLSSVRVVKLHQVNGADVAGESNSDHLIVSAGGRAQIILWKLIVNFDGSVNCSEMCSHYEQLAKSASETRIMDVCLIDLPENKGMLLLVARSDGFLKFFLIVPTFKMVCVGEIFYKLRCILRITHVKILTGDIIILTGTDGKISFWDISKIVSHFSFSESFCDEKFVNLLFDKLRPFREIKVHQSGINTFFYKRVDRLRCLLLSGGDDGATFFEFS